MGVRGLTSFCASIEPHIFTKIERRVQDGAGVNEEPTPFVVDASAFLFHSFQSLFGDTLFGGEYASYARLVTACVQAWRAAGLKPIFVFDGSRPVKKDRIVLQRFSKRASSLSLYMHSSPENRVSIRWQVECGFLPPLLQNVLFDTLKALKVDIVLAQAEADSIIVTLSGKLGGYAVSRDSDMFIYKPPGARYKGYVPVHSLAYQCRQASTQPPASERPVEEDDGFTAVSSRKSKRNRNAPIAATAIAHTEPPRSRLDGDDSANVIILPCPPLKPNNASSQVEQEITAVTFSAYLPDRLATYLDLSVPLLPMLAAILGNDCSHEAHDTIVFPHDGRTSSDNRNTNPAGRVRLCSRALREEVKHSSAAARGSPGAGGLPASASASRAPSTPASPNPWRRGGSQIGSSPHSRLGSGRATPRSPARTPSSGGTAAGLDASFVSIRSLGSSGLLTSGFSTPRAHGSEWGGDTEGPGHGLEDDDDGASVVSSAAPFDPVRSFVSAVIRRIVLGSAVNGSSAQERPVFTPRGTDRRAADRKLLELEGTAEWNAVIDDILDGITSYTLLMQIDPDDLTAPDLARFTSHLGIQRDDGDTFLLDDADDDVRQADRVALMKRYAQAFQERRLFNSLSDILFERTYLCRFVVEDPDASTIAAHLPYQIRQWVYAILFGAYGLEWARDTIAPPTEHDHDQDDDDESTHGNVTGAKPIRGGLTSSWIMPDAREVDGDPDELILVQTPPSVSSFADTDDEEDESELGDGDDSPRTPARPVVSSRARTSANGHRQGGHTTALRGDGREGLQEPLPPPIVTEIMRRGDRAGRIAAPIPSFADLLRERNIAEEPNSGFAVLRAFADPTSDPPTKDRHKPALPTRHIVNSPHAALAFRYILRAAHPAPDASTLPRTLDFLVLTLRYIVLTEGDRWAVSAPKHNWRPADIRAAAYAACIGTRLWRAHSADEGGRLGGKYDKIMAKNAWAYPKTPYNTTHRQASVAAAAASSESTQGKGPTPPSVRAIQLSSTLQATLEAVHMLRQALLLPSTEDDDVPIHAYHEGPLFHAYLAASAPDTALYHDDEVRAEVEAVVGAVLEGVDEAILGRDLEEERRRKKRRNKDAVS